MPFPISTIAGERVWLIVALSGCSRQLQHSQPMSAIRMRQDDDWCHVAHLFFAVQPKGMVFEGDELFDGVLLDGGTGVVDRNSK